MDNSICHNGKMITQEISDAKFERLPHPAYSPDLSPCDFWLFGMLKQKVKDRAFQRLEEILEAVTLLSNDVTFEQLQSIFLNWMERLEWVISNGGDHYIN
jgi:histone-lysine N-methyltransferase SETMAR